MIRNFEDWAFGLTFLVAGVVSATIHDPQANAPTQIAMIRPVAAPAAELPVTAKITVTARRLPAVCKGQSADTPLDIVAYCQVYYNQEPRMEVYERINQYALKNPVTSAQ